MRIDAYLAASGILSSRTEAKRYIEAGAVTLDGRVVEKPSFDVTGFEELISVDKEVFSYVSRGGIKLEGALKAFNVDPTGKICLDVGASSGGFTDCLLSFGAKHVIAVDSGQGQMAERLRADNRVTVIEGYNARYMKPCDFEYVPSLAVMDVSFISATYIIEPLSRVLPCGAEFICLIKPQFEVGRQNIGKGGIVKEKSARDKAVKKVTDFAKNCGFTLKGTIESPIKGGDGNVEFLAYFIRN